MIYSENLNGDPFDMGSGLAYVRGEWVECHSEYYSIFRGRSEREVILATAELRRRSTRHSQQLSITAARLAHFLESVEAEEELLRQRTADREVRNVLKLINNEMATPEPSQNSPAVPAIPTSGDSIPPKQMQSLGETRTRSSLINARASISAWHEAKN